MYILKNAEVRKITEDENVDYLLTSVVWIDEKLTCKCSSV
jgi:hypothetical protein